MSRNYRRGGVLAGVLFSVLLLSGLAIIAIVGTGLYIAQNVRVTERHGAGETTVETPIGSFRVREYAHLDPSAMGLPIYPGAVREPDSHKLASFHLDFAGRHKEFAVSAAEYRTFDSVERVAGFYRDKLPHWMFTQKDDDRCPRIRLELKQGGHRKMIAIFEDGGETHIALASVGEPAAN